MKVNRPKWAQGKRTERVHFMAPAGTREAVRRLSDELTEIDGQPTQGSDTYNAILSSNKDFARHYRQVQKELHDTSTKDRSNEGGEEKHSAPRKHSW